MTRMYFKEGEEISGLYQANKITLEKFDYLLKASAIQNKYISSDNNQLNYLSELVNLLKVLVSHPIRLIVFIVLFPLFLILFLLMLLLAINAFFKPKIYKHTFICKDNIRYQGFILPDYIVFSNSQEAAEDPYNYYIARVDQNLYLKKLSKEIMYWEDKSKNYLEITDLATIKKMENTFLTAFDAIKQKVDKMPEENIGSHIENNRKRPLNDQEKQIFKSLAEYCLSKIGQDIFHEKLDGYMTDASGADVFYGVLYELMVSFNENNFHFVTHLDWKEGVDTLQYCVERTLRFNFGLSLTLPAQEHYDEMDSISSNSSIFKDFNMTLKPYGLKLGNIDTQGDEYLIIVYKATDEYGIKQIIDTFGYKLVDLDV